MASRWADTEADKAEDLRRKKEKEEKKRLKFFKQQEAQAAVKAQTQSQDSDSRPSKRRRLSNADKSDDSNKNAAAPKVPEPGRKLLRFLTYTWSPCRHVSNFTHLNQIEEGSYGYVSRATDLSTLR